MAARRVTRVVPLGPDRQPPAYAVSPDGRWLAAAWLPPHDGTAREPVAAELPHARLSLIDLTGDRPPRTLVAPRGDPLAVAFAPDGRTLFLGATGAVHLFRVP